MRFPCRCAWKTRTSSLYILHNTYALAVHADTCARQACDTLPASQIYMSHGTHVNVEGTWIRLKIDTTNIVYTWMTKEVSIPVYPPVMPGPLAEQPLACVGPCFSQLSYSDVWHDSLPCVTWIIDMCDVLSAGPSFMFAKSLNFYTHMSDVTRCNACHDSCTCVTHWTAVCMRCLCFRLSNHSTFVFRCVTWLMHMCKMLSSRWRQLNTIYYYKFKSVNFYVPNSLHTDTATASTLTQPQQQQSNYTG